MASIGSSILPSAADEGSPYFLRGNIAASPGGLVTVFTATVPALTLRKLKTLWVTAVNDGDFSLEVDGSEIAAGRIDPTDRNISFIFNPPRPVSAGGVIMLKYTSDSDPSVACPITAFLSASDFTTT